MAQYIVLDAADHVVNIIEWDGHTYWQPPPGTYLLKAEGVAEMPPTTGWKYDRSTRTFADPTPPLAAPPNPKGMTVV